MLCDVRASRKIEDRPGFLRRLEDALERVNARPSILLGSFDALAGVDEFAGVVRCGDAGNVLLRLWEDLHPVAVRYAIVAGELDVIPEPEAGEIPGAARFDGPAFHLANDVLNELRGSDRLVAVRVGTETDDRLLSALGDLVYARILAWTERQLEVVRAHRRAGSQRDTAQELSVSQSTVSRSLSAADYERVEAGRRAFAGSLDDISRETSR